MPFSLLSRHLNPGPLPTPLQAQVDGLVGGFAAQATDWRSLAAITAGGAAYRVARVGVMGLGSGNVLRAASIGLGLSAEVSTFEWVHRGITSSQHENLNLWRWNGTGGIRQGLFHSFIAFGALKGVGRLAQGENLVVRHLLQDTAMVAGHQVSGALGVTPRPVGSLAEQFLHAEATNLQIGAGMALAGRMAPGVHGLERGLDLSLRVSNVGANLAFARNGERDGRTRQDPAVLGRAANPLDLRSLIDSPLQPAFRRLGPSVGEGFRDPLLDSQWNFMTSHDGKGGGDGPRKRPSWLSRVFGRGQTSPSRDSDPSETIIDFESIRLIRQLNEVVVEEMGKDFKDGDPERRQRLHSIFESIARTSQDSSARNYLTELPRSEMARILRLLRYLETPFTASPLSVVGTFRPSPEVMELIEATEARRSFGSSFLSYEVFRPQGVRVIRSKDGAQTSSLILRVTLPLRRPPGGKKNFPALPLASIYKGFRGETEILLDKLGGAVRDVYSVLSDLKVRYPRDPILRLELELWPPSSYQTRRRVLDTALLTTFNRMLEHPFGKYFTRIKVDLKGLGYTEDLHFVRSQSLSGNKQFILETPDPLL